MQEPANPYEPSHVPIAASDPTTAPSQTSDRISRGCLGTIGMLVGLAALGIVAYVVLNDGGVPNGAMPFVLIFLFLGATCLIGGLYLLNRSVNPPRSEV